MEAVVSCVAATVGGVVWALGALAQLLASKQRDISRGKSFFMAVRFLTFLMVGDFIHFMPVQAKDQGWGKHTAGGHPGCFFCRIRSIIKQAMRMASYSLQAAMGSTVERQGGPAQKAWIAGYIAPSAI